MLFEMEGVEPAAARAALKLAAAKLSVMTQVRERHAVVSAGTA
jgi:ribosomal protein L16/L10AE